jgi:pimeloyl-ACP methyl ester carboxylesterase
VADVADALEEASRRVSDDDPHLIVVAHSMGGNIVYDLLTHYRPDLRVDVLATVGSQVAFFEELKLFMESDPSVPSSGADRVPRPANVDRWINIFDRNDILSFTTSGVFDGVEDYEYSTGEGILLAHTTYFLRPSFHDRLGDRLAGPGQ